MIGFLASLRPAKLCALAALVAGCTAPPGMTLVHSPLLSLSYTPSAVGAFGPTMPVQIVGRPPDGSSPQEVAAQMRMPAWLGRTPLELVEGPTRGQRIVVVFNPSGRLGWCESPSGASGAGRKGAMVVGLAYCRDAREFSSLIVESRATQGPQDAGFTRAMTQGMLDLLPTRDPKAEGRFSMLNAP